MAKRIFRNIVMTAVLAVLLTAVMIVFMLYNVYEGSMHRELRQQTESVACALNMVDDDVAYLEKLHTDSRLTLIASDGAVLFDSAADADQMENHLARPEVIQALENGSGESTRTSDTLSETTLYCAVRTDGGCVLRIAQTRRSMLGTFLNVLPLILGILLGAVLAALHLARRAAKRIVAPINALNLDAPLQNETYDELAPLLTRMHRQHEQINRQMHALETAHAELTAIMANMREGMVLLDENEIVLSVNESAAQILDVSSEKAVGQNLLNVYRDASLHEKVRCAFGGEGGSFSMERGCRQYEVYVSPVRKNEVVCGAVMLILDVTERFAAEKSRREFTANVSHELKTPLTSISGFAEIIRDGVAQPQDVSRFADRIFRESRRMIALVNDIMELSRLDEHQNLNPWKPVALMPMLREVAEEFAHAAEKRGLTLKISGDEGDVFGDAILLREMFFNLIDNAVKYTPEGGVVSVSVENRQDEIVCSVSDTGVGIPEEHQTRVFERFYRVDKSHSRQTGGTGLGLAIVKHIAQIHQAKVELESEAGRGTTVRATFRK